VHKAKSELALGFGSKALKAAEAGRAKIKMAQESRATAQMLADLGGVTSEAERILKAATPKSMPVSKIPKDSALNSPSSELHCGNCGIRPGQDVKLMRCKQCSMFYYCNVACQKKHWPTHKQFCLQSRRSVVQYVEKLERMGEETSHVKGETPCID